MLFLLVFIFAAFISIREKEGRAGVLFITFGLALFSMNFACVVWQTDGLNLWSWILILIQTLIPLAFFIPLRFGSKQEIRIPLARIDERDIMFSRSNLKPESKSFIDYYKLRPEKLEQDNHFRTKPGLLSGKSTNFHLSTFKAADANFRVVEGLKQFVEGEPANERQLLNQSKTTKFIKEWSRTIGADGVGITKLMDYHKYSVIGRGDDYGQAVELDHKYAIAFIVEKNEDFVGTAPLGPVVMESSDKYLRTGVIAVQVAEFIRSLGYEARAHIDGNYRIICPLVARDAGLGVIGRMGLLMTRKYGPRVRVSVVTTNLPLDIDQPKLNASMINFCKKCNKCATNCPSSAISMDEMRMIDGVKRWQINSEACFLYWTISATDCGICMKVCPYSHPNNILHRFVRWGISNNILFSRLAISLDDLFYGKKPKTKKIPEWMNIID